MTVLFNVASAVVFSDVHEQNFFFFPSSRENYLLKRFEQVELNNMIGLARLLESMTALGNSLFRLQQPTAFTVLFLSPLVEYVVFDVVA
jgi:hypothetical protein